VGSKSTQEGAIAFEHAEQGRLADLYLRHAPSAVRLGYLLTGDQTLAEDLVQDAFVKVAGRLTHLRDSTAFEAYLQRTVVNLSKNVFRRRSVERVYLERAVASVEVRDQAPDVAAYETMRAALLALPPRQRAALVLRFYEDLPESQIADLLRCRPGTVRSLVTRGVQALRVNLKDSADAE
jgi:RNA polymerase sigma-70 factor (sigma-E family)